MCDKSKYVCRGFGTVFDDASSREFDNDFPRNVALFGVDNSLLSHADNCKNNFLALKDQLMRLMTALVQQKKSFVLRQNFT